MNWYEEWFNEDYLALYTHRSVEEAEKQVEQAIDLLALQGRETILDVGCGAGRHAIAFANRGFRVTGVDLSQTLLDEAQKKASEEGVEVPFLKKDMRHLEGLGPFDCAVSFFTSFGYFEKEAEDLKMLKSVYETLRPGGRFLLDYLDADHVRETLVPHSMHEAEGERVEVTRKIEGTRAIKTIAFPHKTYRESVRLYTPRELEYLLYEAGFASVTLHSFHARHWLIAYRSQTQIVKCAPLCYGGGNGVN